jgi:multidrug efflux pump subunit AcrB
LTAAALRILLFLERAGVRETGAVTMMTATSQRVIVFFGWFSSVQPGVCVVWRPIPAGVSRVLRKSAIALGLWGLLLPPVEFQPVPTGFVPTQDKQYLVLPTPICVLDRTEAVIRRMSEIGLKQPGVKDAVAFPGLSISGFSVAPNAGIVFFGLQPFEERRQPSLSGTAIAGALNGQFASIQDAFVLTVPPPPVQGLGTIGGFKLYVEDRADLGYEALYQTVQGIVGKSYQTPGLGGGFSTFTVNVRSRRGH